MIFGDPGIKIKYSENQNGLQNCKLQFPNIRNLAGILEEA